MSRSLSLNTRLLRTHLLRAAFVSIIFLSLMFWHMMSMTGSSARRVSILFDDHLAELRVHHRDRPQLFRDGDHRGKRRGDASAAANGRHQPAVVAVGEVDNAPGDLAC